jgi:hypothetical protein
MTDTRITDLEAQVELLQRQLVETQTALLSIEKRFEAPRSAPAIPSYDLRNSKCSVSHCHGHKNELVTKKEILNELALVKCHSQCLEDLVKKMIRSHIAGKVALGLLLGYDTELEAMGVQPKELDSVAEE